MCAIFGFVSFKNNSPLDNASILRRIAGPMVHRGPDDAGMHVNPPIALGHCRLSIIDVSGGHQPIANEDKTVYVSANGEIYNFKRLRKILISKGHQFATHSDSEAIVHAYEEYGIDCVKHFEGMFAFAIWDAKLQKLILARDRMGEKPLHYTMASGEFIFSSELKGILQHPLVSKQISANALSQYLLYEYVPAPNTIFEGIFKLLPGERLVFEAGQIRLDKYWDVPLLEPKLNISEQDAADKIKDLLSEAVKKQLVSDVPLGAFLSGGIDSSAVAAFMAKSIPVNKLKTFTIGFEEPSFDESPHARRIAKVLGTEHHEHKFRIEELLDNLPKIFEFLDEPLGDASILPTYLLAKFTRRYVKVALSGDGGDELFAGYPTFQAFSAARYYERLPKALRTFLEIGIRHLPVSYSNFSFDFKAKQFIKGMRFPPSARHHAWLGSFPSAEQTQLLSQDTLNRLKGYDPLSELEKRLSGIPGFGIEDAILAEYVKGYLQDDILVKVDRATMACSLESRAPFLDHHLVEFVSRLPYSMKMKGLTTKYILKKALKDLLPRAIIRRPKKGFGIPIGKWLRKDLRGLAMSLFDPSKLNRQGLFNPDHIQRLFKEHISGKKDNRKQLWTLLVFQLWYERTFEKGITLQ